MKKALNRLSYIVIPVLLISIIYWDNVKESLSRLQSESNGFVDFVLSAPVTFISFVIKYFTDMDSWAWITAILVFVTFLIIFTSVDLFFTRKIDGIKSYKWQWLKMDWFNGTVQKLFSGMVLLLVFVIIANVVVKFIGWNNKVELNNIDGKRPVVVLGTNKYLSSGKGENLYYTYRIDAAAELYKAGKASLFIVSGDRTVNDSTNYDEPQMMKESLMARGVPAEMIQKDNAGYRTLDSILRIRSLFKLNEFLVVSQAFHTERALLLGNWYGLKVNSYNAAGTSTRSMIIRELMAKPKAILDLLVFNMQPKEGEGYEYRQAFKLDSKASGWLIIVLGVSVIMILRAVFAVMDKRTEGVSKSIKIAGLTLVGSLVLTLSIYKNLDIESLDNVMKAISDKTGILEATVARKEKVKEIIKKDKIETAKAVIERGEENKEDVLEELNITAEDFEIEIEDDYLLVDVVDDSLVALDNEPRYRENYEGVEEAGFNSATFGKSTELVKKEDDREEESSKFEKTNTRTEPVVEEKSNDPFANSSGSFSAKGSSEEKKVYGKTESNIKALVMGEHTLSSGDKIRLRLRQGTIINGEAIPRNTIFTSTVEIKGKRLIIPINSIPMRDGSIIETNLFVYDLDNMEGIKLNIDDDELEKKEGNKQGEDSKGMFSGSSFGSKALQVKVAANYEVILNQR